jgi:hypothetical protein
MQHENAQWTSDGADAPLFTIATNQESLVASSWMTVVGGALELQHTLYLRRPSVLCDSLLAPHGPLDNLMSPTLQADSQPWPR